MKNLLIALAAALAVPAAWATGDAAQPATTSVKGEVLEVRQADAFTYLRLKTATGETWAAVNKTAVKKGEKVTVEDPMFMQNFESKSLKRTFDSIVLGRLAGTPGAGGTAAPAVAGARPADPGAGGIHGGAGTVSDIGSVKVAKATGADARTVAEVHADRLALKDKPVTVRAKVVKVTAQVMGKNWIHLRDGSGSAADHSDDLVVTSQDEPRVGDVVVAKGTVRTDVNLGSGYAYKVLVEDAALGK
jgi:hypothetical protein